MIDVGFDGVIFGLQPIGGITTYALEIASRYANDADVKFTLGLPKSLTSNRKTDIQALPGSRKIDRRPITLSRFGNSNLSTSIVHSSYYRISDNTGTQNAVTVYDFVYERYRTGPAAFMHSFQKRRSCKKADLIFCISENTRVDLLNSYPGLDENRAIVTPLAVDRAIYYLPDETRSDLEDMVLFVGQRGGYKRFDLAISAVALTKQSLAIVGAPLSSEELQLLNSSLGDRWRFLGRLSDAELRVAYASSFAFVYSSDYEGFGLPILEAQACGCPVVLAKRSSFPEVGREAALYANEQNGEAYADCLLKLESMETRQALREKGFKNLDNFSWDKTYTLTRNAIDRIVG